MAHMVWDTTGILYAAGSGQADWLKEAVGNHEHVVTELVVEELSTLNIEIPEWITVKHDPSGDQALPYLQLFEKWLTRVGGDIVTGHNVGEASTFAWTEWYGGIAIVDDSDARKVARRQWQQDTDVTACTHGVLWAISRGVIEGRAQSPQAYSGLCDAMLQYESEGVGPLRWPFTRGGYAAWFQQVEEDMKTRCCLTP